MTNLEANLKALEDISTMLESLEQFRAAAARWMNIALVITFVNLAILVGIILS